MGNGNFTKGEDKPNIELNTLLYAICDKAKVRIVNYKDDSVLIEGTAEHVYARLQYADADVLSVEISGDAIEIVVVKPEDQE